MSKRPWMLKLGFVLLIPLLGGCAFGEHRSLPYDDWSLRFFSPDYMEVWIETADVVDIKERVFRGAGSGVPATGYPRGLSKGIPTRFRGDAKGWFKNPTGKGRFVRGADLPRLVYVRWQSMAEPQTYEAYIEIPESARKTMLQGERTFCRADGKWITDYRDMVVVGLAPGGIAKVWLGGQCLLSTEAIRVQGTISSKGPYGGTSNGKHRPLSEESKAYIEKFGIPYGSW
ncbi:DUF2931 family protein [Pseudomonas sp. UYIF39]|uniref:DUF2931 family protein n=1 Tax=unclassified Pseudomonas TaxID=196821 RepID=UPI0010133C2A|nr:MULTISPECIES: DUF2931 family protein [unclassified Pseudomonas]MDI3353505.1 DUF2931 family protein [Pseudomonas sp. UYIF39]QAY94166.1 hypothetical protein CUN63_12965 [Pseudomonas sp. ACM7]